MVTGSTSWRSPYPIASAPRLSLGPDERSVAARAQVSGNAWLAVWVPALLAGRDGAPVRVAPVAHLGDLLGFIVAERRATDTDFDEERGPGARRPRPPARPRPAQRAPRHRPPGQPRRAAGAQHRARRLPRPASSPPPTRAAAGSSATSTTAPSSTSSRWPSSSGLARQLLDADPATAATMLEELRDDAQVTLTELRELAHGIYPPLLRTRGLPEALQAAANRAVLPTNVEAGELPRFDPDVEAAVYFCCLEAIQNAGKHAGADAHRHGRRSATSTGCCASPCTTTAPASIRDAVGRRPRLRQHGGPPRGVRRHPARRQRAGRGHDGGGAHPRCVRQRCRGYPGPLVRLCGRARVRLFALSDRRGADPDLVGDS